MPVYDKDLERRLPRAYAHLARQPGPAIFLQALALYGVKEYPGAENNPQIMGWRDELRAAQPDLDWIKDVYTGDGVPWCGLFLAICALRAGHDPIQPRFLAARSWAGFGMEAGLPAIGDVLVFWRGQPDGSSGHVGFYAGEDDSHYHVLGGNQADSVSITRIDRTRLLTAGVRRPPPVKGRHPGWLQPFHVSPSAADVTENEA